MAEDIDIEEHDLLQNPKVQSLFPDLSILKQEIIDFDEGSSEVALNSMETDIDISIIKHEFCDDINISETSTQPEIILPLHTKNIPGSTPKQGTNNFSKITDLKWTLQNVRSLTRRTKKFCNKCSTCYPSIESCVHKKNNSCPDYKKTFICSLCEVSFTRKCDLTKHERNVHCVEETCNEDAIVSSQIKKANEDKAFDLERNYVFRENCFHCREVFQNQQDLIDHLYSILYNKKTQDKKQNIAEKNINCNISQKYINKSDIEMERKTGGSRNFYSCPVCSYYFNDEMFCKSHAIIKHKAVKKIHVGKSSFNPRCKFCAVNHDNIFSYNTHLRKNHKTEMIKPINSDLLSDSIGESKRHSLKDSFVDVYTKYDHLTILEQNSKDHNNQKGTNKGNVQVVASKIVLFKCSECNIHFITSDSAFKHSDHSRFKMNWQCTSCHRLFKNKDANIHQKQHECSEYFVVVKVDGDVHPTTMYKCPMCAVHFSKETISEHCSICESEPPSSNISYCKVCDIFVEYNIKTSHENDHKIRNLKPSDIKIIDTKIPIIKNDSKTLNKYALENKYKEEKPYILDAMIINIDNSISIEGNNEFFHNKRQKTIRKKVSNKPKIIFDSPTKKQLSYNFCNVCKCNICIVFKPDIHLRSHCVKIAKYICKFCGLIFSSTSIKPHRRLHQQHKSLKLQDLTFYNLQTNKIMKPPIPEFPKCDLCEKHFISKAEIKGHLCDVNDYFKCSICKTKFSEISYKVHIPFHNYNLTRKSNQSHEAVHEINVWDDQNDINKDPPINKTRPIIYTCINCDVSLTTYDDVIEHCHLHTNLNKVEVNCVECATCQLKFVNSAYERHEDMHKNVGNIKFKRFNFDVSYFGSDKWLKHIYKAQSKDEINKLTEDSIYKYETRLSMGVIQEGLSNLTIYKCEKCQCVIDCNSTYSHIVTCCPTSETNDCKFCDLSFTCRVTRNKHEKIHTATNMTQSSFRIIMFNREQDRNINSNISNFITTRKSYVVHECRYCHVLVEKYNYAQHLCFRNECKKCNICGLLLFADNLNDHLLKHKLIPSFNENKIKVVLVGNKSEDSIVVKTSNILLPTFNGIVCDYTFYKCVNCEVCVRDLRNTVQHSCLVDAAKSQCIKCDLIFDEGKLKGHLKLHDTDPDFTKETILVKPFSNRKLSTHINKPKRALNVELLKSGKDSIKNNMPVSDEIIAKVAKLYKCLCGLHYMKQSSLQDHIKRNLCKTKQSIQNCSKCGLRFKSDVLFRHLLEHHGDKNVVFKYEIVENLPEG